MTPDRKKKLEEAIAQQERAHAVIMAALHDEKFMDDVFEGFEQLERGEKGEPLEEVRKRLKVV